MFELYPELAQIENNITEIQILVSRQFARTEQLAEKGADTTEAKDQAHGPEQIPLDHEGIEPPLPVRIDPMQGEVVLNRGTKLVMHR
jgi:hypothetical protein